MIVLKKVIESGPIGIMKLSLDTGIPEHRVRYSLRVLEQQGLVTPSTHGAVATKSAASAYLDFKNEVEQIIERMDDIKKALLDPLNR